MTLDTHVKISEKEEKVLACIRSLDYGMVTVIVQDGVIVRVKTEKQEKL